MIGWRQTRLSCCDAHMTWGLGALTLGTPDLGLVSGLVIAACVGAGAGWALTRLGRRVLTSLNLAPRLLWPTWVTMTVTASAWVVETWWCARASEVIALILLLPLTGGCVLLWQIDRQHHRLPNVLVLGLYPVVGLGLAATALISTRVTWSSVAAGAGLWLVVFAALHLMSRGRGMGLGDVKLAPLFGGVLGWFNWDIAVLGLLAAFIIGGIWASLLLLSRRVGRQSAIAFGPFMILGLGVGLTSALALAG